ncbi:hypothetical protein B0T17DRAFT_527441 [Bombardia bombarda]|uniref:Uncharacterized protein n=1 Tax=Bombardia bombarda TaxID=252184 RepID=A0AA40CAC1_9PEZI|nr:hypothetical protein B0T17DRAFT_527441 [Bombardia bombarda]
MFASKSGLPGMAAAAATWLLLLGTATASGQLLVDSKATPAHPTDVWVSVNDQGHPATVTPALTIVDGTPTIASGAPYEVTGTVFTKTKQASVTIATGVTPQIAHNDKGEGAFALCNNKNGTARPFCLPADTAPLYPEDFYYITWDPTFFTNNTAIPVNTTSLKIIGFYTNGTANTTTSEAFSSPPLPIKNGFYPWPVMNDIIMSQDPSLPAVNITLKLVPVPVNASDPLPPQSDWIVGPTHKVMWRPRVPRHRSGAPDDHALYIGLPTFFGVMLLLVLGTTCWNRRARRVTIGNIMSRSRHAGYSRLSKRRREKLLGKDRPRRDSGQDIGLMDHQEHHQHDEDHLVEEGWRHGTGRR